MEDESMKVKEWIVEELSKFNENWNDIIYCSLIDAQLLRELDSIPHDLVPIEMDFEIWTKEYVYAPFCFDNLGWKFRLIQMPRNPPLIEGEINNGNN